MYVSLLIYTTMLFSLLLFLNNIDIIDSVSRRPEYNIAGLEFALHVHMTVRVIMHHILQCQ